MLVCASHEPGARDDSPLLASSSVQHERERVDREVSQEVFVSKVMVAVDSIAASLHCTSCPYGMPDGYANAIHRAYGAAEDLNVC